MQFIKDYPIEDLKEYKGNPRKNQKAIEPVGKSIEAFGFINPIIIDSKGIIRAGHTRYKYALEKGLKTVPVIKKEFKSEEQARAYGIADNKSQDYAEWDSDLLKGELKQLEELGFELELTGFNLREIGDILDDNPKEKVEQVEKLGKHTIECPKCKHKFERKER